MKKIYLLLISFICLNFGYGQTLQSLAKFGRNNTEGSVPATISYTANHVKASGYQRGEGINIGSPNSSTYHRSRDWDSPSLGLAEAANEYIQWSITANDEFEITLTQLKIQLKLHTTGGPQNFKIYYSTNNFINRNQLRSGNESFSVPLNTDELFEYNGLNIKSGYGGTITFRLYAWNSDGPAGQLVITGGPDLNSLTGYTTFNPNYDGLLFDDGVWFPEEPSLYTEERNATISSGTYKVSGDITAANLTILEGSKMDVEEGAFVHVLGDLNTSGDLILNSTSTTYSSIIVEGAAIGNAQYKRHVNIRATPGKQDGNDLISAPVSGESFDVFRSNNPNLRQDVTGDRFLFGPFNKTTGDYDIYTKESTDVLIPAKGYRAASTDNGTFTFTGVINTTNVSIPIEISGPKKAEWNLIGNPYPSYLKASAFLTSNINKLHPDAAGIYAYNGKETKQWDIINSNTLNDDVNRYMTPGQGFYVAAKDVSGTSIIFRPNMRIEGSNDDYIQGRDVEDDQNRAHFKLNISNGAENYDTDLYFNDQSTRGLDPGYDARTFVPEPFSLYTHLVEDNNGTNMAIQSLPFTDLTAGVSIPVGIVASEGMQITVNISEFNLPEGTEVRLEDNSNNTFTLLNTSDYTFTATSNLKDIGRFFLHVSTKPLSNKDDILNGLQIYTTNKSKTLYVKGLIKDQAQVNIYDIQGRIMTSASLKANTNSNEVDMSNLSTGIYVAELKSSGSVKTQKVILK